MEKVYLCKNREGVERGFTAKELKEQEADEWEKQLPYFKNGKVSARPVYLTKWEAEHDLRYKEYVRVKGKIILKRVNMIDRIQRLLCGIAQSL